MTVSRRNFLKAGIAASTASMAGLSLGPAALAAAQETEADWQWDKTVCRFCGTGCGLMLATSNGRVVAQKGDVENPVNRGWQCVKGYFNAKIMYGQDRLTQPLMRMKDGQFHKQGDFVPVSWEQAFDEMERQLRKTYAEKGPEGIACFGSGQWTIQEGYAMNKLFKAGFRSNNIDPNARNCMASAVVGFYSVFGTDEPAGNYDDIENTDTMILWGANMAEMHTVLWSRIINRRMAAPNVRIVNLTTFRNMSSDGADLEIVFKPNTDLAIQNYIAREIIARDAVNWDFVNKHTIFATGPSDIGYGLRPGDEYAFPAERDIVAKELKVTLDKYEAIGQRRQEGEVVEQNSRGNPLAHWSISFEDYKKALEPYTLDFVAELSKGDASEPLEDFKAKLQQLADLYIEANRKVVSFWTMGFNQHQRGSWVNQQVYANHLLLGKHAQPGNGAFSLTGQPTACGTAREVGTFSHRLPADRLIGVPAHREFTEAHWKLPAKTINPKPGSFYGKIMRDLEDGSVKWAWVQVNNPWHTHPNSNHWIKAAREKDNFIIVSEAYPGISAKVADLILPVAMIFEKWGAYGNAERRTQHWREQVPPPGVARGDLWQVLEFAKRFTIGDFWGELPVPGLKGDGYEDGKLPSVLTEAGEKGYSADDSLYKVLFATADNMKYAWPDPVAKGRDNHTVNLLGDGWFVEKALWQEYVHFGRGVGKDLADFDVYHRDEVRGLRWPVVDGKEGTWRFNEEYDPYVTKGAGFEFYGKLAKAIPSGDLDGVTDPTPVPLPGKAKIFFRPYAAPVEQPDENYDLWLSTGRVLEHWHSGTMTRRVPELHRAVPAAVLWMHPEDASERGMQRNDLVWIESRRGKIQIRVETTGRNTMPKGMVYAPFFDEGVFINKVAIDAACPMSKESDYKKCAVKVYKV